MDFEKLDMLQEQADQLVVTLNPVERGDFEELVELFFGRRKLDLHVFHEVLIRGLPGGLG